MPPSPLSPTPEQEACIAAAKAGGSLMISAYAGCAKSSTLEMMAPGVKEPTLALAFNRKIADELGRRLPPNFSAKTLNGLGHGAWVRANRGVVTWELNDRKMTKIISEVTGAKADRYLWEPVNAAARQAMVQGIVPTDVSPVGLTPDTLDNWSSFVDCDEEDLEQVVELAREVLRRDIIQARQGLISFDDQVYCPTLLGGAWPRFPRVFGDEVQDWSPLNLAMIGHCLRAGGSLAVVGDRLQCHPIGTMIKLAGDGGYKAIEELVQGIDEVVSYNRKVGFTGLEGCKLKGKVQGRKIIDKRVFHFDGELIRINAGQHSHECTPEHRCMVRWTDKTSYCVYLMQKGIHFRVGISQAWYTSKEKGNFGPAMRARQEGVDKLWILKVCRNKEEAMVDEKVIWTLFGLPDLIFRCSGEASSTQNHLDSAWDAIGDNSRRAMLCLKHFKREYDFPIWRKGEAIHVGEKSFITQACNLISGSMSVRTISDTENWSDEQYGDNDAGWNNCFIEHVPYNGPVVGITVEPNGYGLHLYVANGIVTHNSIYAFRGADSEAMTKVRGLAAAWQDLPLTLTFRCPKAIVARQQAHAPGYRAYEANAQGRVEEWIDGWGPAQLAEGMTVLCRNVSPLMKLAFRLLRAGVGCQVAGRDIGRSLIALSRKIVKDDDARPPQIIEAILRWRTGQSEIAIARDQMEKLESIQDRAEALMAVLESSGASTAGDLRTMLEQLFARESGAVLLSTIHRAKSLEWPRVMHLDPWRIPSKQALRAGGSALQQESNLRYVAETRTQELLVLANLDDWRGSPG